MLAVLRSSRAAVLRGAAHFEPCALSGVRSYHENVRHVRERLTLLLRHAASGTLKAFFECIIASRAVIAGRRIAN